MEWTRSKPTEPGYYWYWSSFWSSEVEMLEILIGAHGLVVTYDGQTLDKWRGYWQRIERPAPPHVEGEQC